MIESINKPLIISKYHGLVDYEISKRDIIILTKSDLLVRVPYGSFRSAVKSNSVPTVEIPIDASNPENDPDPEFTPPALSAALSQPAVLSENLNLVSDIALEKRKVA
jgi:hypothetical protein